MVTRSFSYNPLGSYQPSIAEKNCTKSDSGNVRHTSPELWLYNTMSRKKELFKPRVEGKVGMFHSLSLSVM
ncbi:Cysteine-tRNA ligase-like protein [Quillaja saponaria]|uniref:Cysteine-tRNA ligase-like protein n=1 Tax=Quillaja saponaria TaxID=32244 RepID=A0AAD7LZB0_QUISA|nr:Cysteine-tRNA ligase-like protein [Quillaja saponaria]